MFLVKEKPATFTIITRFYKTDHINRVSSTITIRSELVSGSFTTTHTDLGRKAAIAMLKSVGYESSDIRGEINFTIAGKTVSRKVFENDVKFTLQQVQIRSILNKYL